PAPPTPPRAAAGGTSPEMARRVEVLPAPFGPMMATTSRSPTSSETPFTAVTLPYRTSRSVTASTRFLRSQIGLDHRGVLLDLARRALGDPHPVVEHGDDVAEPPPCPHVVLPEEDRPAPAAEPRA